MWNSSQLSLDIIYCSSLCIILVGEAEDGAEMTREVVLSGFLRNDCQRICWSFRTGNMLFPFRMRILIFSVRCKIPIHSSFSLKTCSF